MDYSKLSSITDSVNKPQSTQKPAAKSVKGLTVEKPASVLDKINTKVRIADSTLNKVKYVFIDDSFITKVMTASRPQKRAYLSRLTDAQRRRLLDRWSQIKDATVNQLDLVNAATLIQNAIFNPNDYNKNLLKDFVKEHPEEEFADIAAVAGWIENDSLNYEDATQKELIDRLLKFLADNDIKNSIYEALHIVDIHDSADIPEEVKKQLEKAAVELATKYVEGSIGLAEVITGVDNLVWPTVNEYAFESQKLEEIVTNAFNNYVNENRQKAIRDSVIDKIAESELLDDNGNPIEEEDKPTVLELLSSAIEKFAEGDDSELKSLSKIEVEGATVSLDVVKEDEDEKDLDANKEDEEIHIDIDADDENLADSVSFARALLQKKYEDISRLEDTLSSKVTALKKYSFKIQDYCPAPVTAFEPQAGVVNPPLNYSEYHSIRPEVPGYIGKLAKQGNPVSIPPKATIEKDGDYINVSFNGTTQKWMPIVGSIEDINFDAPSDELISTIEDNCVPVYDAHKAAAFTNNLDVIDSRFYKKHLNDCAWCFEEVPSCIACVEGVDNTCQVQPDYCKCNSDQVVGEVDICGSKYLIIKAC